MLCRFLDWLRKRRADKQEREFLEKKQRERNFLLDD